MRTFLFHLMESGHVAVLPFDPSPRGPREEAEDAAAIFEMDRRARLEFPGEAPALDLSAAQWAAAIFYQGCQLLVCRDVSAAAVGAALGARCPRGRCPETHYSVDLVLRYLPDLLGVARHLAAGDALVEALGRIALEWPLSSVGVSGLKTGGFSEIGTFIAHPKLRQLYADRIIQHHDTDRMQDAQVKAAVRETLGEYVETLGPNFAALFKPAVTA